MSPGWVSVRVVVKESPDIQQVVLLLAGATPGQLSDFWNLSDRRNVEQKRSKLMRIVKVCHVVCESHALALQASHVARLVLDDFVQYVACQIGFKLVDAPVESAKVKTIQPLPILLATNDLGFQIFVDYEMNLEVVVSVVSCVHGFLYRGVDGWSARV